MDQIDATAELDRHELTVYDIAFYDKQELTASAD